MFNVNRHTLVIKNRGVLNLCIYRYILMRYIIHLYLVLGNRTQVHLQCTWVVPKYISQNPVLVLVLEHF